MKIHLPSLRSLIDRLCLTIATLIISSTLTAHHASANTLEYVVFNIQGEVDTISLGQKLFEGDRLLVPNGVAIQLISKDGKIVDLVGPIKATVTSEKENESAENALASLSTVMAQNVELIKVMGGTRSVDGGEQAGSDPEKELTIDAWIPLLSQGSPFCAYKNNAIILRQSDQSDLKVVVENSQVVNWESGQKVLSLTEFSSSIAKEGILRISFDGKDKKLFLFQNQASELDVKVEWLLEKGCKNQALRLFMQQGR